MPPLPLLVADVGLVDTGANGTELGRQRQQRIGIDERFLLGHDGSWWRLPGEHGTVRPVDEATEGSETAVAAATDADVDAHTDGLDRERSDAAAPQYRQPPEPFTVRRPEDDDLTRIADLYARAASAAPDGSTGRGALRTTADLRRTWSARRNDALVVERDDDLAGYLEFDEQLDPWTPCVETYAEGRVDPAHKDHGVGAFLLGRALDRARDVAEHNPRLPVVFRTTLVDPHTSTITWFTDRGLTEERHLLQLRIDLAGDLPEPVWPAGVSGVRADRVPVADLHTALVAAFSDHHLGATEDLETWEAMAVERGRVQLRASVAALDEDGAVVGVALGHVGGEGDPGLGVIVELGVVPAHRGAGLATALLRTCFQQFAHLGVERVGLEVDDVTLDGALRLYERAGMEVVHHTVVLRMDI